MNDNNHNMFKCDNCGGTFEKAWSEEEALAELHKTFTPEAAAMPQSVVCEDCYNNMMGWLCEQPEFKGPPMPTNGYKCFYNGKTYDVYATSMIEAKNAAVAHFKVRPRQAHMISVVLCEKDGETVTHSTSGL